MREPDETSEGEDGTAIQLWDARTGELLPQNQGAFRDIFAAAFSSEDRPLVVATVGKTLSLWDVAAAKELYRVAQSEFERQDRPAILFFPDGSVLFGGDILSLKGSKVERRDWKVPVDASSSILAISADKNIVVADKEKREWTGSGTGKPQLSYRYEIEIWEMATGKKLRQFVVAEAKDEEVGAVAVWTAVLSPDGRVLVLKHTDEVTLWETATGKQLHRIKDNGECCQFAFSPDGKMLALLTMGFTLRFHRCEVATGKDVQHLLLNREGDALLKMRGDRAPVVSSGPRMAGFWPRRMMTAPSTCWRPLRARSAANCADTKVRFMLSPFPRTENVYSQPVPIAPRWFGTCARDYGPRANDSRLRDRCQLRLRRHLVVAHRG